MTFYWGCKATHKSQKTQTNCTLFMDDLFAQIEVLCKKIENEDTAGENRWGRHTEANKARIQTNPNKKPRHDRQPGDNKPTQ